jgi:Putative prokaryotic signal transducing protein
LDVGRHPSDALYFVAASYNETGAISAQIAFRLLRLSTTANGGHMAETPEPLEKLVKVFDTDVESEAMVVQGLLESAGIEAIISNREAPQDVLPGVGGVVILVREEQAKEAAAMIEEFSLHPTTDEDEEVSEEPAGPKP